MKNKVFFHIAFRIILMCVVGMLATFIPDQLRDFFGDVPVIPQQVGHGEYSFIDDTDGTIDQSWVWGVRHYWFFWMMLLLFILALINSIVSVVSIVQKEYPHL